MQKTACQKLAPFKSFSETVAQTDRQTHKQEDSINYIETRANARRPVTYVGLGRSCRSKVLTMSSIKNMSSAGLARQARRPGACGTPLPRYVRPPNSP